MAAGTTPAPLSVTADTVADAVVRAYRRGKGRGVDSVGASADVLRYASAATRHLAETAQVTATRFVVVGIGRTGGRV